MTLTRLCRIHAASVLHVMHMLVHTPGGLRTHAMLSDELELAVYLAAACHDYEHLGLNNDFLIKSRHEWAQLYNDRSPLENHHASAGFKQLQKHLFDGGSEVRPPISWKLVSLHFHRREQLLGIEAWPSMETW